MKEQTIWCERCGEEITGNKEWSNLNIAKKNSIQTRKVNKN